jgi:hypothetical protein
MEFETIPDVEVVQTGTYKLGTGTATFTEADLIDAVAASTDPTIVAPRIRLGHTDKRFDSELDAEPAFGTLANLRLTDKGQKIVADLQGVPKWLAASMPTHFPGRSIEGGFAVDAPSGKRYRLVIANLALLGTTWPGITSLDDLQACLSENGPVMAHVEAGSGAEFPAATGETPVRVGRYVMAKLAEPVSAAIDLGAMNRRFAADVGAGKLPALPERAWARSVQADGDELYLLLDDDEGHLLKLPFTAVGEDVSYGTPEVYEVAASANIHEGQRILASWPSTREAPMEVNKTVLRTRLGLAEDADEAAILAALETPEGEPESEGEPEPEAAPVAASTGSIPEGMTLIDTDTLGRLQAGAEAGLSIQATLAEKRRDDKITAAIDAGKFAVGRREHYEKLWASDPEGTSELLDKLPAGLVPVGQQISARGDGEGANSEDAEIAAFTARFLPELVTSGGES